MGKGSNKDLLTGHLSFYHGLETRAPAGACQASVGKQRATMPAIRPQYASCGTP